jgi:hypothetical protein
MVFFDTKQYLPKQERGPQAPPCMRAARGQGQAAITCATAAVSFFA